MHALPKEDKNRLLIDHNGNSTAHLHGLFHRGIKILGSGIKPVFVFDGDSPPEKAVEVEKRKKSREDAEKMRRAAIDSGDFEMEEKMAKRALQLTDDHLNDAKKMLRLMGIPVIDAPGEAEMQCAALASAGTVYATASEDMDSLTFGSPILLRNLCTETKANPVKEFNLSYALDALKMNRDQFVDLCILLGCDYCGTIKGIGPVNAWNLMKEHKSLENVIKNLDREKFKIPENFNFQAARDVYKSPLIIEPESIELNWTPPNEKELQEFLLKQKRFQSQQVSDGVMKMRQSFENEGIFEEKPEKPKKYAKEKKVEPKPVPQSSPGRKVFRIEDMTKSPERKQTQQRAKDRRQARESNTENNTK
eukprot:TRINITY_DN2298_c0_g1_i4.p1 TRINITY_DN2298_c0_g1~~TRINITY_DN2298_c0_g1_i4.p1  ORF type:complete len:410 (+),score=111.62 TRINITY_DN2298_c0_g1_i4:144-1232(+)